MARARREVPQVLHIEAAPATCLTAPQPTCAYGYSGQTSSPRFNDAARQRAIVMHGAWYANPDLISKQGRLGRSQGCPALREQVARVIIDDLKQRHLIFHYADDAAWLQRGRSFACDGRSASQILAAARAPRTGGGSLAMATSAP